MAGQIKTRAIMAKDEAEARAKFVKQKPGAVVTSAKPNSDNVPAKFAAQGFSWWTVVGKPATPKTVSPRRAAMLLKKHSGYHSDIQSKMEPGEVMYVRQIWDSMPNRGRATFRVALGYISRGFREDVAATEARAVRGRIKVKPGMGRSVAGWDSSKNLKRDAKKRRRSHGKSEIRQATTKIREHFFAERAGSEATVVTFSLSEGPRGKDEFTAEWDGKKTQSSSVDGLLAKLTRPMANHRMSPVDNKTFGIQDTKAKAIRAFLRSQKAYAGKDWILPRSRKAQDEGVRRLGEARRISAPNPRGQGWSEKQNPHRWLWSDRSSNVNFTVFEKPGPGIPVYKLRVLTDNGMFEHARPSQWNDPKGAFLAASKWFKTLAGEDFIGVDMRTNWSKV